MSTKDIMMSGIFFIFKDNSHTIFKVWLVVEDSNTIPFKKEIKYMMRRLHFKRNVIFFLNLRHIFARFELNL